MNATASTILNAAQQIMTMMTGGLVTKEIYFTAYLDNFPVNGAGLTDQHKQVMDAWIAGSQNTSFPFRPDSQNSRLVRFTGLASQTGPEANNQNLGKARAQAVYDYLAERLPAEKMVEDIRSYGSSQPRPGFDNPGSEHGENRAVEVTLEAKIMIITAPPPPPPPEPPPAPASKQWELCLTSVASGAIGFPPGVIDVIGSQKLLGKLRNLRTDEVREFKIISAGLSLGKSVLPIDFGTITCVFTPFTTYYVKFEDFHNALVFIGSASGTIGAEYSSGAIGFVNMKRRVEPEGFTLRSNVGVGVQMHYGIMRLMN